MKTTTALGKLQNSIYGHVYDNTTFSSKGGSLMTRAGIGCIVRGALGKTSDFPYIPGESLPTTTQILEGAAVGFGFKEPPPETMTLLEITCDCKGSVKEDISYVDIF